MAISAINLGNFFTNSGGNTVSSGISSGLNTDSIIEALTAAKQSEIDTLNDQVDINNSQTSALTTLSQILSTLQSSIKTLSNPSSFDYTNNLFAVRTANITSNTSQSYTNYLTASVASGTASGTYTISDIVSLATATVEETNSFTLADADDSVVPAVPAAGYFKAGTVTLFGQNITVSEGDSLADIAQAFNDVSSETGIGASVLQVEPGKYKLIFTATSTGEAYDFDLNALLDLTSDPDGVFDNITITPKVPGADAEFKLNDITIKRPTNTIDDLISGVTFNLLQDTTATPSAAFTITIAPDRETIVQGIDNFAAAYNKFLYFYAQQTERDSNGVPKSTAVLSGDATLANIYNSITTFASSIVKGLPDDALNSFASIGISFTDYAGDSTTPATSNILSVDNSKLLSLLSSDFDGVAAVFGDTFTSSSSSLVLYQAPTNSRGITELTFNINQTTSTYTASYVDENDDTQTVTFTATELSTGGISLKADEDSVLAGMTLLYLSSGNESGIDVTLTQGILSQMNTLVNSSVKAATGLIAQDQKSIVEKNTTLQKQIDKITEEMNTTRDTLLAKYSALEAAITKANSVLSLLNAQQIANQSS